MLALSTPWRTTASSAYPETKKFFAVGRSRANWSAT